MESKSRRKSSNIWVDSFEWAVSPAAPKAVERNGNGGDHAEEFLSAGSRLSRCSSATSLDAFLTAKTCLSRCSSLSRIEFQDFDRRRRSIILELIHCEGWPFGLCRKALLLPPLPKSPADSWLWSKSCRIYHAQKWKDSSLSWKKWVNLPSDLRSWTYSHIYGISWCFFLIFYFINILDFI